MPFKVIQRTSNLPQQRMAAPVTVAKTGKMSRVRISGEVATQLGWAVGQKVAIAIGNGSDAGWVAIYPDPKGYKIRRNGGSRTSIEVGTQRLFPTASPMGSTAVEHVIQEGVLYVATPAVVSEPKRKANGAHKAPTLSMVAAE